MTTTLDETGFPDLSGACRTISLMVRERSRADPAAVPEAKILSLGVLYGPGIAVLAVVAIAVLSRYPIDRARHARTTAALGRSEDDTADHP